MKCASFCYQRTNKQAIGFRLKDQIFNIAQNISYFHSITYALFFLLIFMTISSKKVSSDRPLRSVYSIIRYSVKMQYQMPRTNLLYDYQCTRYQKSFHNVEYFHIILACSPVILKHSSTL